MDEATKKLISELPKRIEVSASMRTALEEATKSLAKVPNFSFPSISSPEFRLPEIPTLEKANEFQSASVLMEALADEALQWKERLPEGYRPAILAIMYGGLQIHVKTLSKVSFHGVRVEGTMGDAPCSLLAHQSSIQLLCYAEEVAKDEPRNPIGFVWDDRCVQV
jgi:hypothetical protein